MGSLQGAPVACGQAGKWTPGVRGGWKGSGLQSEKVLKVTLLPRLRRNLGVSLGEEGGQPNQAREPLRP